MVFFGSVRPPHRVRGTVCVLWRAHGEAVVGSESVRFLHLGLVVLSITLLVYRPVESVSGSN